MDVVTDAAAAATAITTMHPQNPEEEEVDGGNLENQAANSPPTIAEKNIEMCRNESICLYDYCADGNLPT